MSGSRPSFRAAAAQRLAEDGGALSPAVEDFLSDTRPMAVRLLPLRLVDFHALRADTAVDAGLLAALVASVRQVGVLEPILVRPRERGRYEVVAGERRVRAARVAGLETIPAVVRELDDETAAGLVSARPQSGPTGGQAALVAEHGRSVDMEPAANFARPAEPPRPIEVARPRRATNGTYMPPAVVTRREPRVISGPGIPGPGASGREPWPAPSDERAAAGDDGARRPRFRFAPFPFLRRERGQTGRTSGRDR